MTADFEAQHPRAGAGRFTEKDQADPGTGLLTADPLSDEAMIEQLGRDHDWGQTPPYSSPNWRDGLMDVVDVFTQNTVLFVSGESAVDGSVSDMVNVTWPVLLKSGQFYLSDALSHDWFAPDDEDGGGLPTAIHYLRTLREAADRLEAAHNELFGTGE